VSDLYDIKTCIPSVGRLHRLSLCWQNLLNHENVHPRRRILIVASKGYQVLLPWRQADFCFVQTPKWTEGMAYAACVDLSLSDETWKYLLIVEDDVTCKVGIVKGMLDLMEADSKIGMVTPIGGYKGAGKVANTISGKGMLLIRRKAIETVGNFCHDMPMRAESEYAIRLALGGYDFRSLSFREGLRHKKLPYGGCADLIGGEFNTMDQRGRTMARKIIAADYHHKWLRTTKKDSRVILLRGIIADKVADGSARAELDIVNFKRRLRRGYTKADLDAATWL
jgi:hypothetical protein